MAKEPLVGLFATCLVDAMRPQVGFAAAKLLEDAGCIVDVPPGQTCCGQPAYNNGDRETARALARQVIDAFKNYDYVVVPSGSCAGMIHAHYPALLADDPNYAALAVSLAGRTFELVSFLVRVLNVERTPADFPHKVAYHDSCSGLRELGIKEEPRKLLASVAGLELKELAGSEECCGFGGTFCVKYPEISTKMVDDKVTDIEATGASTVLAGDMGCLMNIAGRLKRKGSKVEARHVAEVLAGFVGGPAIGEERSE
jgi:L-lactate dehydrogenase complex protein LldE